MEKVYIISLDGKPCGITQESEAMGGLTWFHLNKPAYSMDHALNHEGYSIAEGEPDCRDVAALLEGIAERIGLTAEFEFVPFSRSRNATADGFNGKPWESLNWKVTLRRSGSGRVILTTDYGEGVAHAPAYKLPAPDRYREGMKARAISAEIETGRKHLFGEGFMYNRDGIRDTRKPIDPPRLGDVLQSLAQDSRVLDEGTFEQWAESLGYDPDSRKAEATWKACVEIATALRGALGSRALEELQLAASFN